MTTEPRKASDVLLELEKTLNVLLSIVKAQDLNIKVLSNKLNVVMEALEKQSKVPQKITVEAVNTARPPAQLPQTSPFQPVMEFDPSRQIPIHAESRLPMDMEPTGFRRTSRPETFAGDDAYLPQSSGQVEAKFPVQIPKAPPGRSPTDPPPGRTPEITVPAAATKQKPTAPSVKQQQQQPRTASVVQNAIPVMQRVVDGQGKSLFLADVEVIDLSTMQQIFKTRTSGIGKWMASLGIGQYRVIIRKMEKLNNTKREVSQDIQVDGTQSPLELQTIIIK